MARGRGAAGEEAGVGLAWCSQARQHLRKPIADNLDHTNSAVNFGHTFECPATRKLAVLVINLTAPRVTYGSWRRLAQFSEAIIIRPWAAIHAAATSSAPQARRGLNVLVVGIFLVRILIVLACDPALGLDS